MLTPRGLLLFALLLAPAACASPAPLAPSTPAAVRRPERPQLRRGADAVAYLNARRAQQVDTLRAYAQAGVFPRNFTSSQPLHMFRDGDGRLCAVANLIAADGRVDLVDAMVRTRNDVVVGDEASGPLHDWVLTSGLTREEVDRIQAPSPLIGDGQGYTPGPVPAPRAISEGQMVQRLREHFASVLDELEANREASVAVAVERYQQSALARAAVPPDPPSQGRRFAEAPPLPRQKNPRTHAAMGRARSPGHSEQRGPARRPARWLWGALAASLALAPACRKLPRGGPAAQSKQGPRSCLGVLRGCDGEGSNGCETRLGTDAHCGGCNQRCGQGERCVGVVCQPAGDLVMTDEHTCALDGAGRVRCWGANRSGELGDGTKLMRDRPVAVAGVDDAVQIVAREGQTCVRRRSGAVACWGRAFGSRAEQLAPTEVEALRGAADIALAEDVFCGLMPGRIVCLPSMKTDKVVPRVGPPPGEPVTDAVDLAATSKNLCASRRDGSVVCWDMDPFGNEPPEQRLSPVADVADAVSLDAGRSTVCAIRPDGRASCWGGGIVLTDGGLRQVAVGGVHDFGTLGPVTDLSFVGWPHDSDCATLLGGDTVCWRPPSIDTKRRPAVLEVQATTARLPPAYRVEAGGSGSSRCALTRAGQVYCWGKTSRGGIGLGRPPEQPSPLPIKGVRDVREVVASESRACARAASGAIRCWGGGKAPYEAKAGGLDRLLSGMCASIRGELVCFDEPFSRPLPASGLRDVVQLVPAAWGTHLLAYFALHRGGEVSRVEWKRGNGSDEPPWTLRQVARLRGLAGVSELLDANGSTCVRDGATALRCWSSPGDATPDKNGTIEVETKPLTLPEGFEQIRVTHVFDGGAYNACGVRDGRVACWDRSLSLRWAPLSGVRRFDISPDGLQCVLVADGTLSCWSGISSCLTGHGSLAAAAEPTPVPGLVGVVGWSFMRRGLSSQDAVFAWLRDGRLLAWGHNGESWEGGREGGQLGWLAPAEIEEPTRVEGPGG